MAELCWMIGAPRWQAIADDMPQMLTAAAKVFGAERVVSVGYRVLGYPVSWVTGPNEIHPILDELEQTE